MARGGLDRSALIHNYMVVDQLGAAFMALSDPTRRSILIRLAQGPASVNELAEPFKMSQQAVSKHLAYLQRASLIAKTRRGRQHFCTLNPIPFQGITGWVEECRRFWEQRFERFDLLLEEMKQQRGNQRAKR